MGRKKKIETPERMRRLCDKYFDSISMTRILTEAVDSGERTNKGKVIYKQRPVLRDDKTTVTYLHYFIPPTMADIRQFLGLSAQAWSEYCAREEYKDVCDEVRGRIEAYLERELVTRNSAQGIIFNLKNNFGWSEKQCVELGEATRRELRGAMTFDEKMAVINAVLAGEGKEK